MYSIDINRETGVDYIALRQFAMTNLLTKIVPLQKDANPITGFMNVVRKGLSVEFAPTYHGKRIGASTYKLFDAIIASFTARSTKNGSVAITMREYMTLLGLRDMSSIRRSVLDDLALLSSIKVFFQGSHKNSPHLDSVHLFVNACIEQGIIKVTLTDDFANVIKRSSMMYCPALLWQLHPAQNPHAYFLLRRLAEHKRINLGAYNEDCISVRTLLDACPLMPSHFDIMCKSRHVGKQIIQPFIRDMNVLSNALTWKCYRRHADPFSTEEVRAMGYHHFENLLVEVEWIEYPPYSRTG